MKVAIHFILVALVFSSCKSDFNHSFSEEEINEFSQKREVKTIIIERDGLKLTEVNNIPPFEDVAIHLQSKNVNFRQGNNNLEFKIDRFNLGTRTIDENQIGVTINPNGQYLVIADSSGKVRKYYANKIDFELKEGKNYLATYLCRSYGISLKGDSAHRFFTIQCSDLDPSLSDSVTVPYLLINSPEQNQVYKKNAKILIDFMKYGFDFKQNYYLEIKVNQTVFKVNKWAAFVLEGLDYGKYTIEVKVKDKKNDEVKGFLHNGGKVEIEVKEDIVFD